MMDTQSDKSPWTSSFKKLLKSTEDDKTLRVIHRIIKRALTGNKTDEQKIGQNKLYAKEKYHVSRKNALVNRNIKEQRSVRLSLNESLYENDKTIYENPPELHTINFYQTVKVEKPKLINLELNEFNNTKVYKIRKALTDVFDINYNEQEYPSYYPEAEKIGSGSSQASSSDNSKQGCSYYHSCESIDYHFSSEEEVILHAPPGGLIVSKTTTDLEIIDSEVLDKTNEIPEYATPIKSSKNSTAEPIYATIDEDVERLFIDTDGNILTPIRNFGQQKPEVEERFIVNLFENKCMHADKPNANIVKKTNSANITPDKTPQKKPKSRNTNRVVTRATMDELERLDSVSLDDLIKELDISAEKFEQSDSSDQDIKYENYKNKYEQCDKDCCTFTTQKTKIVENIPKQEANNNSNSNFFKLKQEADVECKVMRQASKALDLCRSRGNGIKDVFVAVEAEKILLTASCRYERILREIRQDHYENPIKFNNVGSVNICGIKLNVEQKNIDEWYVCILSNEEEVFSTKPTQCEIDSNHIIFDDKITFNNMDSNFVIKLEVYSLKIKRKKEELRMRKNKRTLSRASRKLFYKDVHTHSLVESNIPASSFKSRGVIKLNVNNLMQINHAVKLIEGSSLEKFAEVKAHVAEVKIGEDRTGFLTVGTENNRAINWNRRWCALNGTFLKCWNYPNEEYSKYPLEILDLSRCSQEVVHARRSWCPRPKTLLVCMDNDEKKYLNADCVQDMYDWRNTLNRVYMTLQNWKMLQNQQGIYI